MTSSTFEPACQPSGGFEGTILSHRGARLTLVVMDHKILIDGDASGVTVEAASNVVLIIIDNKFSTVRDALLDDKTQCPGFDDLMPATNRHAHRRTRRKKATY